MLENIDGTDAYVLTVTAPSGEIIKNYYNAKTFYKIKQISNMHSESGDDISTSILSDYRELNGIMFPYASEENVGGQSIILKVTDIKINSGLTDADFK